MVTALGLWLFSSRRLDWIGLSRRMCSFFLTRILLLFRSFSFSLSGCCHGHLGSSIIVLMVSLRKKSPHCDLVPFPLHPCTAQNQITPLILAFDLVSFMLWHERNKVHSTYNWSCLRSKSNEMVVSRERKKKYSQNDIVSRRWWCKQVKLPSSRRSVGAQNSRGERSQKRWRIFIIQGGSSEYCVLSAHYNCEDLTQTRMNKSHVIERADITKPTELWRHIWYHSWYRNNADRVRWSTMHPELIVERHPQVQHGLALLIICLFIPYNLGCASCTKYPSY